MLRRTAYNNDGTSRSEAYEYTGNPANHLPNLPHTHILRQDQQVIARAEFLYDGHSHAAPPDRGRLTLERRWAGDEMISPPPTPVPTPTPVSKKDAAFATLVSGQQPGEDGLYVHIAYPLAGYDAYGNATERHTFSNLTPSSKSL